MKKRISSIFFACSLFGASDGSSSDFSDKQNPLDMAKEKTLVALGKMQPKLSRLEILEIEKALVELDKMHPELGQLEKECMEAEAECRQYTKYRSSFPFIKQFRHAGDKLKKYIKEKDMDYDQAKLKENMPDHTDDQILDLLVEEYRCLNFYKYTYLDSHENLRSVMKQPILFDSIVELLKEVLKNDDFLDICDYAYATHRSLMFFYRSFEKEDELNDDLIAYDRLNERPSTFDLSESAARDRLARAREMLRFHENMGRLKF